MVCNIFSLNELDLQSKTYTRLDVKADIGLSQHIIIIIIIKKKQHNMI
jgi:hypothetical protein